MKRQVAAMDPMQSPDVQIRLLRNKVEGLERMIQGLLRRVYALESGERKVAAHPEQPPPPPFEGVPAPTDTFSLPSSQEDVPAFPPAMLHEPEPGEFPRASGPEPVPESLESRIGGNWLNKIGMIAVVLGVVYFLKYAIDNRWIGEMGRVMLGILAGIGFLAGGESLQRRGYRGYGLTLCGGGIAILYFSIFAAFNFYSLLPQIPAFLLMALITCTAVMMAIRFDSRVIAILGILGGFSTPLMLATGKDNQVALLAYIVLLDLGILALAYHKNWRSLNLLAFAFTQVIFLLWAFSYYTQEKLGTTLFFQTLFFLIFAIMAFLYNIIHRQKTVYLDQFLILKNGAAYFLWCYFLLEPHYFAYLGFFAVLLALMYAGLALLARRQAPDDQFLVLIQLGIALTCLTLAIPIQLKQHWITFGWSVEAAVLTWVGFRAQSEKTRVGALVIVFLVTIRLLFFDSWGFNYSDFAFLLNKRGFSFAGALSSMLATAWLYWKNREHCVGSERHLPAALILLANFLFLFFMTTEIRQAYTSQLYTRDAMGIYATQEYSASRAIISQMQLTVSAFWAIYSIIMLVAGILRRFTPIRWLAMLLFGITILKVFIVDLSELEKVYRIISFIGLGGVLLIASFLYQRFRAQLNELIRK
jgi:uncharacterized membrane protein